MNKADQEYEKRRVNIKTIGAFLLVSLFLLTFVSKTIYNHNLPVVTATSPVNGKLEKTEIVKGIAEWGEKREIYTNAGGFVEDIFVEEGESVLNGQALLALSLTKEELSDRREKDYELQQLETDIKNAEEDYSKLRTLYEAGALSKSEFEKEDRSLQALYRKKEKLILDRQDTLNSDSLMIYASQDSVITELSVHKGQRVNAGEKVAVCGLSQEFKVNCCISLDNNFVLVGDTCKLENSSHTIDGIVTKVKTEEEGKKIAVLIQSDGVKDGETFDVVFKKKSAESRILVPNGALNQDSNGYFLYQIKQRDGMLGKEFYVDKRKVYIGDNDAEYTVITEGVTFFEPIVLLCDKGLSEGDTVILENEGDFFAE